MALALGALIGLTAQAAPMQNKAVVRSVRGTANYSTDRGANWKKLNVGMKLGQGSTVRTAPGSTVDLFLGDNGPVVRVTEDTTMGIDALTVDRTGMEKVIETQLDLRNGRILGNVKKLAAASKYEVKTPQGVAGIRGTKYDISANGRVAVAEGTVIVVYIVGGQPTTATVNAGQVAMPPTQAGGQATITELTPAEIDEITHWTEIRGGGEVLQVNSPVVTTIEAPQGGDPAKGFPTESPISPGQD
jgi:hypothetical protein